MDFQFCQPKFGALPVLHYYPTSRIIPRRIKPAITVATAHVGEAKPAAKRCLNMTNTDRQEGTLCNSEAM